MTLVKTCGLFRACDIEMANRVKPDFVGFIFAKKSHRYVDPETAAALRKRLDPKIRTVGVFVNEDVETVTSLSRNGVIDLFQLHGNEDEAYIAELRKRSNAPIIKAFTVSEEADVIAAKACTADYLLFDHGGGGTGETFDWGRLGDSVKNCGRNFFLAGGLNPENVSEAIRFFRPYAVDVSSGIETDQVKDPKKMEAFLSAVRRIR